MLTRDKRTHIFHAGALPDVQMPNSHADGASPGGSGRRTDLERARDDFLHDKSKGGDDTDQGAYHRNAKREVNRFIDWYADEQGSTPTFDALDTITARRYARHLTRQGWTDGTVQTYYAQFSGFIGWCEREGYLEEHVAQASQATEPLPDDDGRRSGDQQAWSASDRREIISYVDQQADAALDALDDGSGRWAAIQALRDRALVAVLCYTGIRAGELLARPDDHRRNGITWGDINLDDGRVTVFSKKQAYDDRSLPEQTLHPLGILESILEPSDDWPVFVTLSPASVFVPLREALVDAGLGADEIDSIISKDRAFELYGRHDLSPDPLTTTGARRVLRRLTDAADIDLEDGNYLEPHGGRRGAGEVMVRTHGYTAAARLLDNSEQMVRERYSHIEAGELADVATDAFDSVDGSTSSGTAASTTEQATDIARATEAADTADGSEGTDEDGQDGDERA